MPPKKHPFSRKTFLTALPPDSSTLIVRQGCWRGWGRKGEWVFGRARKEPKYRHMKRRRVRICEKSLWKCVSLVSAETCLSVCVLLQAYGIVSKMASNQWVNPSVAKLLPLWVHYSFMEDCPSRTGKVQQQRSTLSGKWASVTKQNQ